jgi:hypothetical protein
MLKPIRLAVLGAALVVVLALGAPASAAVVYVTYKGTVETGKDLTGELFQPNTDLTGMAFSAVFTVNTNLGKDTSGSFVAGRTGGSLVGFPSPIEKALFLIGGKTVDLTGTYYAWAQEYAPAYFAGRIGGTREMSQNIVNNGVTDKRTFLAINFYTVTPSPASLTTLFSGTASGPFSSNGEMQFSEYDIAAAAYTHYVHAYLTPVTVVVSDSAVPEPKTWLSLLVGLGLAGAALRRSGGRRRTA